MKLIVDPPASLSQLSRELELVIAAKEQGVPEIYTEEGRPRPDRHFLLGIVQSVAMAVAERDPETVEIKDGCRVRLETEHGIKELDHGLIIVRGPEGRVGALAIGDAQAARRGARAAVRYFTGTVRLDVP